MNNKVKAESMTLIPAVTRQLALIRYSNVAEEDSGMHSRGVTFTTNMKAS